MCACVRESDRERMAKRERGKTDRQTYRKMKKCVRKLLTLSHSK